MRLNYAIVFVSEMAASVEFYRDVLGLSLNYETPDWTEFSTEGATLALHKANAPSSIEVRQNTNMAGQCHPGIEVSDLDEFHSRVTEQGVTCVQDPKSVFGVRIAQYLDPDGLVIGVSEKKSDS